MELGTGPVRLLKPDFSFFRLPKTTLGRLWQSSLMARVVISTVLTSVFISVIAGLLITDQVTDGVLEGKRQNSQIEAAAALSRMQNEILGMDLASDSIFERLSSVAQQIGSEPSQYSIVLEAGLSVYLFGGVLPESVPEELKTEVSKGGTGQWITSTEILYDDDTGVPGIVIGSNLQSADGKEFPVYFLFPLTREIQTLSVVRQALYSVGLILLFALTATMWLISKSIASPVVEARNVAQRIADGNLNERLEVSGSDEIADLGRSMNSMASTLQNQIARLENLSTMQQRFVSDVSHELRTPLTTLRMGVDMLYEGRDSLDALQHRAVELLHSEVERFERLLSDLLEISRFDAGAEALYLEYVNLSELVEDEIAGVASLSNELETEVELNSEGDCVAHCDPRRIRRIVRNLLTNALEHGEKKPVQVDCSDRGDYVRVTVTDHGVGLDADQLKQVFNRFWRANPSRARTVGGTGLGLSIAQADALLHGGSLEVWGSPGNGASFTLTLPKQAHNGSETADPGGSDA